MRSTRFQTAVSGGSKSLVPFTARIIQAGNFPCYHVRKSRGIHPGPGRAITLNLEGATKSSSGNKLSATVEKAQG